MENKAENDFKSKENQGKDFKFSDKYKFTTIVHWNKENLNIVNRHGKSCKHASVACGQFLRKSWTFLDKQKTLGSVYPSMATSIPH